MLHRKISAGVVPITIPNQIHLLVRRLQLFGVKNVLQYCGNRVFGMGKRNPDAPAPVLINPAKLDTARVDKYFGLEPSAPVPDPRYFASGKWALLYERSSETIFRHVMRKLPIKFEDYLFVDLGAGKGFVLCLAAEYPFKKIVGVEFAKDLAAIACENISVYGMQTRKCRYVSCSLGDAAEFVFPPEPTVLYLYNPFQGRVMDRMIANLKQSLKDHPRDLWIFYANPWEHRKFKRSHEFQVIELTWDYALYHHQPAQ
jgi:hypothetical protein